jgi:hypothetical protein
MIHSQNVINGGASNAEAARLWRKEKGLSEKSERSSRQNSMRQTTSQRPEMVQRQGSKISRQGSKKDAAYQLIQARRQQSQLARSGTNRSRMLDGSGRPAVRRTRTDEHTAQDGYSLPQHIPSTQSRPQASGFAPFSQQSSHPSRFRGF